MSLVRASEKSVSFAEHAFEAFEYLGIPYALEDQADLDFVKSLARSTVIKTFRAFVRKEPSKVFKQNLSALNAWPTSSLTSSELWSKVMYAADTFKAKAFKATVMSLMLQDAKEHGLDFLEYFCSQNYYLIWSPYEGYARGHEGLVAELVKKQS